MPELESEEPEDNSDEDDSDFELSMLAPTQPSRSLNITAETAETADTEAVVRPFIKLPSAQNQSTPLAALGRMLSEPNQAADKAQNGIGQQIRDFPPCTMAQQTLQNQFVSMLQPMFQQLLAAQAQTNAAPVTNQSPELGHTGAIGHQRYADSHGTAVGPGCFSPGTRQPLLDNPDIQYLLVTQQARMNQLQLFSGNFEKFDGVDEKKYAIWDPAVNARLE